MNFMKTKILLLAVSLFLVMQGCGDPPPANNGNGGSGKETGNGKGELKVLRYGRGSDTKHLDPALIELGESAKVAENIYDTLFRYDRQTNEIKKHLVAEHMSLSANKGHMIKIKKGIKFHNGDEMTAADVEFSLKRLYTPDMVGAPKDPCPYSKFFKGIESITKDSTDPYKLTIQLKEPDNAFLANLAFFSSSIVPMREVLKNVEKFDLEPVGSGPFKFVNWEQGTTLTIEKNKDYFDKDGLAKVDRVIFSIITDNETRVQALIDRKVDFIDEIDFQKIDKIKGQPHLKLQVARNASSISYLAVNVKSSGKPWSNKDVRKAMAMALEKGEIQFKIFQGNVNIANCPLPTGSHYENINIPADHEYDLTEAKRLLKAAGYGDGFEINLNYFTEPRPYMQDAENTVLYIKNQFGKIGINVNLKKNQVAEHYKAAQAHDFDLCLCGWSADTHHPDNFFSTFFHSESQFNYSGYKDTSLDGKLANALKVDEKNVSSYYNEVLRKVNEDLPIIPLIFTSHMVAYGQNVKGFQLHDLGFKNLNEVTME